MFSMQGHSATLLSENRLSLLLFLTVCRIYSRVLAKTLFRVRTVGKTLLLIRLLQLTLSSETFCVILKYSAVNVTSQGDYTDLLGHNCDASCPAPGNQSTSADEHNKQTHTSMEVDHATDFTLVEDQHMTSITTGQDQHMTSITSAQDQHMTSITPVQDQHMTSISLAEDQQMTSITSAEDQHMTSILSAQDQHVTSISSAECVTVSEDQRKTLSFTLTEFQHTTTRSTSAENQHATPLVSDEDQHTTPSTSFWQASYCTPKKTNIDDHNESRVIISLNKKLSLSNKEEKACTSLSKRKMVEEGRDVIKCKTGGQPICLVKVRKARNESSFVRTPLKRKRNREMNKVRAVVAGKSGTITQQSSELKALSKDTRLQVCASAGVKQSAMFNAYQQQALKSALRLTWSQAIF